MNVVLVPVVKGRDGKCYQPRQLTHEQRNRARWLAHNLVHRDGLSVRQAQRVMAESYQLRRSVGAIHKDLVAFMCSHCAGQSAKQPDEQPAGPARAVHQDLSGTLTGMITDG